MTTTKPAAKKPVARRAPQPPAPAAPPTVTEDPRLPALEARVAALAERLGAIDGKVEG